MIKVCHMTSAHNSSDSRIFARECTSLAKAGYEVYLVARGESREENGVHVVGIGGAPTGRIKRMTAFAQKIYEKARSIDADVYHIHDPELLPYAIKLKRRGKRVIFDSHEFYPLQIREKYYLARPLRLIAAKLYEWYETFVCKRIDAVIEVCTVDGVDLFKGRCKNSEFIGNASPLCDCYDQFTDAPKADGYVCYCGALTHNRGISALVKAAAGTEAQILLAGSYSPSGYENELKELAGFERVTYLGMLNRTEVMEVYKKSAVCYAAAVSIGQYNRCDTLPTKVYEAMAMGLPVILSDSDYTSKINRQYACFYLVEGCDEKQIADGINYLLDHPAEAVEMGKRGRAAVCRAFHWGVEEKKLIDLYRAISEDSGGDRNE